MSWLLSSFQQQFQRHFHLPFSSLAPIFTGTVAVALLDLLPPEQPNHAWPAPNFVLLADIHGASDALKNILEHHVIPMVQSQVPGVELRRESANGITSYTLSNGKIQFAYALTEHLFVLARSSESIQRLILRTSNTPISSSSQRSLFRTETYQTSYRQIFQQHHDGRLYVNIQRIWRTLRPFIQQRCFSSQTPENQLLFQLLDLYRLTTLSWQFLYTDTGGREKFFWTVPFPHKPIDRSFSLLAGFSDIGNGFLTSDQIVSAKTLYYGASRIDALQIWHDLSTLVESFLSPQQQEQFQRKIAAFEHHIQLHVEQEFFPAFGQELAIACYEKRLPAQQQTLLTPEDFPCALFIQITQQHAIEQVLRRLSTDVFPPSNLPQTESWEIHIPGIIKPAILYAAFVRDFLVLSVSRSVIQESLRVAAQGGSLASTPDYQALSAFFPKEGYAKGYINLPRLFRRVPEIPEQLALRAPSSGMMWVTTVANNGFLTESFSPIGGIITGAATIWLDFMMSDNVPGS